MPMFARGVWWCAHTATHTTIRVPKCFPIPGLKILQKFFVAIGWLTLLSKNRWQPGSQQTESFPTPHSPLLPLCKSCKMERHQSPPPLHPKITPLLRRRKARGKCISQTPRFAFSCTPHLHSRCTTSLHFTSAQEGACRPASLAAAAARTPHSWTTDSPSVTRSTRRCYTRRTSDTAASATSSREA